MTFEEEDAKPVEPAKFSKITNSVLVNYWERQVRTSQKRPACLSSWPVVASMTCAFSGALELEGCSGLQQHHCAMILQLEGKASLGRGQGR